jgi:hypothetical protein
MRKNPNEKEAGAIEEGGKEGERESETVCVVQTWGKTTTSCEYDLSRFKKLTITTDTCLTGF